MSTFTRFVLPRNDRLAAVILAVVAAGVYLNTLQNPFVFDDGHQILENQSIVSLTDLPGILRHAATRPITNLSYAFDYARSGLDPTAYHVTNIALHVINVLLLFSLTKRVAVDLGSGEMPTTSRLTMTSFAVVALFAVHPMMTEAVGYVSGRAEVLVATFFLASFSCLRHSLRGGNREILAAIAGLALFLLGLATKETAVMLPPVLLLYEGLATGSTAAPRKRFARLLPPLLLLVLVLALARTWYYLAVEHPEAAGFSWQNLLIELQVFERYLGLMLLPYPQTLVHRVAPVTTVLNARLLTAAVVLAAMTYVAWVARRRAPLVTFGVAWWFLVLTPSAVLIVIANTGQPMAEHRVYLASCGLFMAGAGALCALFGSQTVAVHRWRVIGSVALIVAVGALAVLTVARNRVWSSPQRLWADTARKAPRTWLPQKSAADVHLAAGECETAIRYYRRAIEIRADHAESYRGLAECAIELGRTTEAREALRKGIPLEPRDPRPRMMLARLEERVFRRPEEALRLCRESVSLDPELAEARNCVHRIEAMMAKKSR